MIGGNQTNELARRQETLRRNLTLLDWLIPTQDMASDLPIRTIRLGDELLSVAAARQLLQLGFYTSAIFFPTVSRGEAGLRICLTASHTEPQIKASALQSTGSGKRSAKPAHERMRPPKSRVSRSGSKSTKVIR